MPREISKQIIREIRRVASPVGVRCKVCKLHCDDQSVALFTIRYGGDGTLSEGNDLVALNRRGYLCDPCVAAIRGIHDVDKELP